VLSPAIAYNWAMRPIAPLAIIAAAAILAAGCGSSKSPTSSAAASPPRNGAEAAFKFSACMRSHGVTNFPDPVITSSPGHMSIGIKVDPSETGSPRFASAQKACAWIMPAPSASQIAQQQRSEQHGKLAFASCLRSHGFADFPDPTPSGQLNPAMVTAAGVDIHTAGFLHAALACAPSSGGVITKAELQQALSASQ
jgi:hypothetical protein